MLCERRSAKCSRPAPTVTLVSLSMMMKPPMSRLSAYGSNGIGRSRLTLHTPISLSSSVVAARWSRLLMSTRYFGWPIVAPTVRAPIFIRYGRPGSIASSCIHTTCASNWSATSAGDVGGADHVAAAGVDLVGEGERDRLTGDRLVEVAVHRDDALDGAGRARRQHADRVTGADRAADDAAGEPAEVEVRTVHPLHRHAERSVGHLVVDRHGLEVAEQRRAVVPRRVGAQLDDVVARSADSGMKVTSARPMRPANSRYSSAMLPNVSSE